MRFEFASAWLAGSPGLGFNNLSSFISLFFLKIAYCSADRSGACSDLFYKEFLQLFYLKLQLANPFLGRILLIPGQFL